MPPGVSMRPISHARNQRPSTGNLTISTSGIPEIAEKRTNFVLFSANCRNRNGDQPENRDGSKELRNNYGWPQALSGFPRQAGVGPLIGATSLNEVSRRATWR